MKNTGIIIGIVALVVIVGGVYVLMNNKNDAMQEKKTDDSAMMEKKDDVMMQDDTAKSDAMMQKDEAGMMDAGDTMMKAGTYEPYSADKIAMASASHDIVLFFRASWCPTCIAVDKDIQAHIGSIPSDLTILVVDYDSSAELKKKYGVTYQHTFVQVDKDGNLIKKWSGSPTLSALVAEVK